MLGLPDFKNWLAQDKSRKKGYLWNNYVWEALEQDFILLFLDKECFLRTASSFIKSEEEIFFESQGYPNLARCSRKQKFDFQKNYPRHAEIVEEWLEEQIIEQKKKKKPEETKPMPKKEEFQQELKEKIKPGTKPSDLKKLKRSKSADDIPKAPPFPSSVPLTKSKSNQPFTDTKYPYTTLISQQEELDKLSKESKAKSETIALLRKKIEELEKELKNNPPSQLLSEQLTSKQKEIESLRKQLENSYPPDLTELDNSLLARHQNLKDWFQQYSRNRDLDKELAENVEEASNELEKQDQTIGQLRGEVRNLKKEQASLKKDLNLANRLAEMRRTPLPDESNWDYLKYGLYSLVAVLFTVWLTKSFKNIRESPHE